MNVQISLRINGQEVAILTDSVSTSDSLALEERIETLKSRVGGVLMEVGCQQLVGQLRHPCCCGRPMENRGRRTVTLTCKSGEFLFERNRYRCRACRRWLTPADAVICCGSHRVTRLLAKNICQLATLEHFTRLERLLADQHGVSLAAEPMLQLAHEVGGVAEQRRLADVEAWNSQPAAQRTWPAAEVTPRRVYVSCDGIMYCTNQSEPDPRHPGQQRLIWKQMRVGCVYWQEEQKEVWHKRVIWGQEEDFHSFGAALYRLACRCGYRQATEKIFAADGGEWCWTIHQQYFADAQGILDWYHANEHVWQTARTLCPENEAAAWATAAETLLYEHGGTALLDWLLLERRQHRGKKRRLVESLIGYLQPKLDRTDYPTYRGRNCQIGTGMIESTARQLVGLRLKGPGMHWCPEGATAMTALRAQDLNGHWHSFWKSLTLAG